METVRSDMHMTSALGVELGLGDTLGARVWIGVCSFESCS